MADTKELITIVVQRRDGRKAVDAALSVGAPGITYFYAQGTGVRQKLGLLGRLIEAEKQVILIAVRQGGAKQILDAVAQAIDFDQPGRGFAFVQQVDHVLGFYEGEGA